MLLSYLKLSLRLLARNPFFTFINVTGLSVGFAVFFVLWQYSQNELKSDQFHKDSSRIVRLMGEVKSPTFAVSQYSNLHPAFGSALVRGLADVEEVTRIVSQSFFLSSICGDHDDNLSFSYFADDQRHDFTERDVVYADQNLFQFFNLPLLAGNPDQVLRNPNSIVISQSVSKKYFGDNPPMGKILHLNNSIPFVVSGVFADLPKNTHLVFDVVLSLNRIARNIEKVDPMQLTTRIYLKHKQVQSDEPMETKIDQFLKQQFSGLFEKYAAGMQIKFWVIPLPELPFSPYTASPKSRFYLIALSVIGVIILGMAWINYINLSASANRRRSKELGTRIVIGAKSSDLIRQFMTEAATINLIACLMAFTLIQLVRQPIETMFHFYIPEWGTMTYSSLVLLIGVLIVGIMLTGFFPVFFTRKSTIEFFHTYKLKTTGLSLSTILPVFQFIAAIVLIIWIGTVSMQLNHIMNKNLGIRTNEVLIVDLPTSNPATVHQNLPGFESGIQKLADVQNYTISHNVSGDPYFSVVVRKSKEVSQLVMDTNGGVDERFIPFYDIRLLAGRNFRPDYPADRSAIIVSINALKRLGFQDPADALGRKILIEYKSWGLDDMVPAEIIGVIEDYSRKPLYDNYAKTNNDGTVLTYMDHLVEYHTAGKVSLLVSPSDVAQTIKEIQRVYQESFPGNVFNWYFLDQNINRHYQDQQIVRNQILFFSILAIGIACLGLLGMISNKVVEKTKEIGIRKVLGAQLRQIAVLLLNTTTKQVFIATVIGIPLSIHLTNQYLERFTDRISLSWWLFALPVLLLVTIMFATIASVLWKAAKSNPVEALKYE